MKNRILIIIFMIFFLLISYSSGIADNQYLSLNMGFNFISLVVNPDSKIMASDLINDNYPNIKSIFKFDVTSQSFKYILNLDSTKNFGDDFLIEQNLGYIIEARNVSIIKISGDKISYTPLSEKNGFQLIPLAYYLNKKASDIIKEISTINSIFAWSESNQNFIYLLKLENGDIFGDDFDIKEGISYFVNMKTTTKILNSLSIDTKTINTQINTKIDLSTISIIGNFDDGTTKAISYSDIKWEKISGNGTINENYFTSPEISDESILKATYDYNGDIKSINLTIITSNNSVGDEKIIEIASGIKLYFKWIPPGEFYMGSESGEIGHEDSESPKHLVKITRGFWMGKYEITQDIWEEVMGSNPSFFQDELSPVETISWNDCQDFINNLSGRIDGSFRLPTEAEWEYSCRAGSLTTYYWGNSIDTLYLWYDDNSGTTTHNVGNKLPNSWGLYDMSGNVWEWCSDWYDENYYSTLTDGVEDPEGPPTGTLKVTKGGGWNSAYNYERISTRSGSQKTFWSQNLGFRIIYIP